MRPYGASLPVSLRLKLKKIEAKDPLDQENEAHEEFRKDRAKVFIGRKDILNEIDRYIGDNRRQPLAIHGASGSGKSALMAKAVQNLRDRNKDSLTPEAVIIDRFIGASPESTNIRLLLESLCKVINRAYAQDEFEVPEDFNKLVQAFKERLTLATSEKPLLIFLDALDQLSQTESAHNLNWLPSELPPNVKIIVSTLPEPYLCLNTLKAKLPAENIKELQLLSPQHGEEVLDVWLKSADRRLQNEQRREVLGNFSQCRLPLYLKLALEEAKRWHSYDNVPKYEGRLGLAKDIPGIIGDLFWRLSQPANHGRLLVERSLGYLAAARNGLTEDEILDFLSLDREFFLEFKGQSHHELTDQQRLPVIVWSRLFYDLEPYLTERFADRTSLLTFYHRQLGEVSIQTYLSGETRQKRHCHLATYFAAQENKRHSGDKKTLNFRKLSELPYQQIQGEIWNELETTLTDLPFIEAKCAAGMTYDLIENYARLNSSEYAASNESQRYQRFLRRHAHRLIRYPGIFFSLIYNEGFFASKEAARQLIRSGNWRGPWFEMEELWTPSHRDREIKEIESFEMLSMIEVDGRTKWGIPQHGTIIFFTEGLGKIAIADVESGRKHSSKIIADKRSRILRLTSSPDATFLVAAYEDGYADIFQIHPAKEGKDIVYSRLASFTYLLPEYEDPVMAFIEDDFWYQNEYGQLTLIEPSGVDPLGTDYVIPRLDPGIELSGMIKVQSTLFLSLRIRNDTYLVSIKKKSKPTSLKIENTDVAALCSCKGDRVAVSLTNRRIIVFDLAQGISEFFSVHGEEIGSAITVTGNREDGEELLWITDLGNIYLQEINGARTPTKLVIQGCRLISAQALMKKEDYLFTVTTPHSFVMIQPKRNGKQDGDISQISIEKIFAYGESYLAIQGVNDHDYFLINALNRKVLEIPFNIRYSIVEYNPESALLLILNPTGKGLFVRPDEMKISEYNDLPIDCSSLAPDPAGGFWAADHGGVIHYIFANGDHKRITNIEPKLISAPQIQFWRGKQNWLTLSAKLAHSIGDIGWSSEEHINTVFFFRISSSGRNQVLECVGMRTFCSTTDQELETLIYLPKHDQFVFKFFNSFRVGSAYEFIHNLDREIFIKGIDERCIQAVAAHNERGFYLVSVNYNLFLVSSETNQLIAIYSGENTIEKLADQCSSGRLLMALRSAKIVSCTFQEVS